MRNPQSAIRNPQSGRRRGAAATELALILPLLVTIVLGCVDFGRFGYMYIAVTNAARAGAGVGSSKRVTTATLEKWRTEIRTAAASEMSGQTGYDAARLTIPDPQLIVETSGLKRVSVQVNYDFRMIVPWPLLPSQVTLSRTVQMRIIR
ncbi:MAG TPA: TadE/TadG family type IV pilus assembly protein [Pirellulaceae bacterium]|nr:TadE/TadG family type IV pilus assembly protein [Pirellulaceae bacterium]